MMRNTMTGATVAGLILALIAGPAAALINPNFTPIHLVEQSTMIVVVDVPEKIESRQLRLGVADVLKGHQQPKSLVLDLSTASPPAQGDAIRRLLSASAGRPALLFAGEYVEQAELGEGGLGDPGFGPGRFGAGRDMGGQQVDAQAFLHLSGRWIALYSNPQGQYQVRRVDDHMEGTWAGGTDMLGRAVRYILTNDDPEVPSVSGVSWGSEARIAKLEGRVNSAQPVWLEDDRRPCLFLACDTGDRLLRFNRDRQQFEDLTGTRKLASKSLAAAWGELSGDGRLDLASWQGQSLAAHLQAEDGTFRHTTLLPSGALKQRCLGLAVVDGGELASVALVISTTAAPQLLLIKEDHSSELKTLSAGGLETDQLGPAGPCLVADFDGDLLPDLLQPFAGGSLLYRGSREAIFADPAECSVALGKGRSAAFLGDFDGDGGLDVLTVAEDRPRLWHNVGAGKFIDGLPVSGEIAYISQPRGVGGMSGDVNNDGRQDVLMLYSDRQPQLFFNRGFRSLGHAHTLDLAERGRVPASAAGQQAGCLAEFSGYGAQDMVLVLDSGEVWALLRDEEYADGLYAGVSLAAACPFAGPLKVTAEADGRSLGAWNVAPGNSAALFGRMEAGPCTVKWQLPGGRPQQKEIPLEDRPVWLSIKQ